MDYNFTYKPILSKNEKYGKISFLSNDRIQTEFDDESKIFSVFDIKSMVFVISRKTKTAHLFYDLESEEYLHQIDAICESFQNSENHVFSKFLKDLAAKYPNFELEPNEANGYTLNRMHANKDIDTDEEALFNTKPINNQFNLRSYERSYQYINDSIYHLAVMFRPFIYLYMLFILALGPKAIIPALAFIFLPNIMIFAAKHSVPYIVNEGTLKINKNGMIEINDAVNKNQINVANISSIRLDYPIYPLKPCYVLTICGDFNGAHVVRVVSPGNHEPHNTLEEFTEALLSDTDLFTVEKTKRRLKAKAILKKENEY